MEPEKDPNGYETPKSEKDESDATLGEADGTADGQQQQERSGRVLVATEPHSPEALFSNLDPKTRTYYDEKAHGYFIETSRGRRKNRKPEFKPDPEHWGPSVVVLPQLPVVHPFRINWGDISLHVALWFTFGSVCWIINGQYFMWPIGNNPDLPINTSLTAYSALVGGLLFWVGAYLAVVESLNEKESGQFGVEVEHLLEDNLKAASADVQRYIARVHDSSKGESPHAAKVTFSETTFDGQATAPRGNRNRLPPTKKWRWIGTEPKSIGWWASIIQYTGATAFTVSVMSGTPGVISADNPNAWQLEIALSWVAQIIGSLGFCIASAIQMLEEQPKWYIPAWGKIGWHSGFWNLIGSIGFLFSAIFGLLSNPGGNGPVCCQFWGTGFNTYYGSWAFLISSVLMLIEVVNGQAPGFEEMVVRVLSWFEAKLGIGRTTKIAIAGTSPA